MTSSITEILHGFGSREQPLGGWDREDWEGRRPRWRQVHGTAIAHVTGLQQECGEVDGLWTDRISHPIGVVTADCVPVLLHRCDRKAVAALHAGWRGTLARISDRFFRSLPAGLSNPSEWSVILGPAIRACCYEVSEDLLSEFVQAFPGMTRGAIEPSRRRLDLVAVLRHTLQERGVRVIEAHPECTFCTVRKGGPVYASYRRGDRQTRQISIISLEPRVC